MFFVFLVLFLELPASFGFVFPGPSSSVSSSSCDPFPLGISIDSYNAAVAYGTQYPGACACTYPCTASKASSYIRFYYNRDGGSYYYLLNVSLPTTFSSTDRLARITFIVHDFADKVQFNGTGWMEPTGKALSNAIDGIVILVDYGSLSNCLYSRMVAEIVPAIGYYLAQIISSFYFNLSKVGLVGVGLGAHIAGYAGAALNGGVYRITGLDPTGDNFNGGGLNQTCASFVQVLHTDVQKYGSSKLFGDSDFFASRSSDNQPGCSHNYCDHTKAIYYYYASIFSQYAFIGNDCDSVCAYPNCTSRFGLYNDGINGDFCFGVAACFPYALPPVSTTTTTTTAITCPALCPPPPPPPYPLPPRRHKKRHRRKPKPCKRPCRKRCRRNCKCCSK